MSSIEQGLIILGAYLGFPETNPITIFSSLLRSALTFLGVVFLLMIVYAGFQWMTAGGSEEKIAAARKTLVNAIVGLVIIFSANSIVIYVVRALTGAASSIPPEILTPQSSTTTTAKPIL